jgi:formylmethanofuran dehydrogenase subunit E
MADYIGIGKETVTENEGYARCHECGEIKADPHDFYDGLICTLCVEARQDKETDDG